MFTWYRNVGFVIPVPSSDFQCCQIKHTIKVNLFTKIIQLNPNSFKHLFHIVNNINLILCVYRPLSYPDTDVILLCFSLENPDSFDNIQEKWIPEVKHYCPNVPIVLVGTKKDLRHGNYIHDDRTKKKYKHIQTEDGLALADRIKAFSYIECSAKTRDGVREVFDSATKAALQQKRRSRVGRKCKIL